MTTVTIHRDAGPPVAPAGDTPSQAIVRAARRTHEFVAPSNRRFALRRLSPLERMMAFKAIGAEDSRNGPYVSFALVACSIAGVDGAPEPLPTSQKQIEAMVARIGDDWDSVNDELVQAFGDPGDSNEVADATTVKN